MPATLTPEQPEPLALLGGEGGRARAQHDHVTDGQALGDQELLGELLVHPGRTREHPGPDVGDAGHLQETLDGAVLAEGAVQHREDDVDGGEDLTGPVGVEHDQAAAGGVAGQGERGAPRVDGRQDAAGDGELAGVVGAEHPRALPRDPDRHDLEALRVQVGEHAPRGHAGHRVLAAAPAEHHRDPNPSDAHGWRE
jgi:hypothetical protein